MAILPERALSSTGNGPNSTRGPSSPRSSSIARHAYHDPPAFTASRNGLPALKVATVEAAISRLSPVLGLRPVRAGRFLVPKVPKPREADGFPSRERGGDTGEHGVDRSLGGRSGHTGFFGYMPDKVGLVQALSGVRPFNAANHAPRALAEIPGPHSAHRRLPPQTATPSLSNTNILHGQNF